MSGSSSLTVISRSQTKILVTRAADRWLQKHAVLVVSYIYILQVAAQFAIETNGVAEEPQSIIDGYCRLVVYWRS